MGHPVAPALSYRAVFLGGLLKRIGHFDMDTFSNRLILQKIVYLMQAFGIYLGYSFSWYLRGPYSPRLTADGFKLVRQYDSVPTTRFGNADIEMRFEEFVRFIGPFKKNADMIELMASIHFLRKLHPEVPRSKISARVKAKQPYFTPHMVDTAWDQLGEAGLL